MSAKSDSLLKEETKFQAVIVAASFQDTLQPISNEDPLALLSVVNTPLLDYSLDWLHRSGVQETIVYCPAHSFAEKIREHCRRWPSHASKMNVIVIASENCSSLGDAMRDLYTKSLLKSDFLLISGDVIGNLDLKSLLERHKKLRDSDKSVVMSCVYLYGGKLTRDPSCVYVINAQNEKMVQHTRPLKTSKLIIPTSTILAYPSLSIHPNLYDPNIAICSEIVPSLFADNFDYGTRDSLVNGVIEQEDLLGYTIRGICLEKGFAKRITSFKSYQDASMAVMKRYNYPYVPERCSSSQKIRFCYQPFTNNYWADSALFQKKCISRNVVVDGGSVIHPSASIENSVIGKNCEIGQNVVIRNSFVMNNVKIENDCSLDACFVGKEATVMANVKLEPGVVLGPTVKVGPDVTIPRTTLLSVHCPVDPFSQQPKLSAPDVTICGAGANAYVLPREEQEERYVDIWGSEEMPKEEEDYDPESTISDVASSDGEGQQEEMLSDDERDREFAREVKESLTTAFKEKSAYENVILEINSSRHAYNVSMGDVLSTTIKGILRVAEESSGVRYSGKDLWKSVKEGLCAFEAVVVHYIKKRRDQFILLKAIEEIVDEDERYLAVVQKTLHELNQEMEVLDDDVIIHWFEEGDEHTNAFSSIAKMVGKFVEWLKEESEEEEEEDD